MAYARWNENDINAIRLLKMAINTICCTHYTYRLKSYETSAHTHQQQRATMPIKTHCNVHTNVFANHSTLKHFP